MNVAGTEWAAIWNSVINNLYKNEYTLELLWRFSCSEYVNVSTCSVDIASVIPAEQLYETRLIQLDLFCMYPTYLNYWLFSYITSTLFYSVLSSCLTFHKKFAQLPKWPNRYRFLITTWTVCTKFKSRNHNLFLYFPNRCKNDFPIFTLQYRWTHL